MNKLGDAGQKQKQNRETQLTCAQRGELLEIEHSSSDRTHIAQVVQVGLMHILFSQRIQFSVYQRLGFIVYGEGSKREERAECRRRK